MAGRAYPELPMVGVGGVVILGQRVLLVRRAGEPARGEWTIPGGLLEVGETLAEGVARELFEETGLTVRVLELIEALERIFIDSPPADSRNADLPPADLMRANSLPAILAQTNLQRESASRGLRSKPRYHFVILDYLCEVLEGEAHVNDEVSDLAFVREEDLDRYQLTPAALRVVRKGFSLARARAMP